MKIKKDETYKLRLYTESKLRDNHTLTGPVDFSFEGKDLIHAIVTMGMLPCQDPDAFAKKRKLEIEFKTKILECVLKTDDKGYLIINEDQHKYFDASEKTAIHYWIGMFFATLLAQKQHTFEYVIHFARLKGTPIVSPQNISYSPDLVAIKGCFGRKKEFGIFEAKGRLHYSNSAMEYAYDQASAISLISSCIPQKWVSFTCLNYMNKNEIGLIQKDPEANNKRTEVDLKIGAALFLQYEPIVELMDELNCSVNKSRKCETEYGYSIAISEKFYQYIKKGKQIIETVGFNDDAFTEINKYMLDCPPDLEII